MIEVIEKMDARGILHHPDFNNYDEWETQCNRIARELNWGLPKTLKQCELIWLCFNESVGGANMKYLKNMKIDDKIRDACLKFEYERNGFAAKVKMIQRIDKRRIHNSK